MTRIRRKAQHEQQAHTGPNAAGSPGDALRRRKMDMLPMRLVQIATDILINEGELEYVNRQWIDVHIRITPPHPNR